MKANAKKLLALILAMVMCLSLAAPAMAAGAETASLAVQAAQTVNKAMVKKDGIKIAGETVTVDYTEKVATATDATATDATATDVAKQAKFTLGKTAEYPEFVKVESKTSAVDFKVGGPKEETFWTVTAKEGNYDPTATDGKAPYATTTLADDQNVWTLQDVSSWATLTNAQNWTEVKDKDGKTTGVQERSGFFYQEKKGTEWNYYFKLYATKSSVSNSGTNNVFDENAEVYFTMATGEKKLEEDVDIRNALFASKVVELDGGMATAGKGFYKDREINSNLFTLTADLYENPAYNADFINADKDDFTVGKDSKGNATITFNKTSNKMYATFSVRLDFKAKVGGQAKTLIVSQKETVEEVLKGSANTGARLFNATITSIEAGSNGYWTVTVMKGNDNGQNTVHVFKEAKDNIAFFSSAYATIGISGETYGVGLKNLANAGSFWYYDDSDYDTNGNLKSSAEKKLKTIDEETKVLGPVAIKKDDLPSEVATPTNLVKAADGNEYYVVGSFGALKNETCVAKKVPYTQLVMNPIINGKENDAVKKAGQIEDGKLKVQAVDGDYYEPVANWATLIGKANTNIMVVTGTYDLAGDPSKHKVVTEYSEIKATCKKKGAKISKAVCKHCGKELAKDEEEIPVVTLNVLRNETPGSNYVYKDSDDAVVAQARANNGQKHYIVSYKLEKVAATKEKAGKVIVHYYCNLGEEHEELCTETEVTKLNLEYSDTWKYCQWGDQNTHYSRDPSMMFGYSPMIFDVDKELDNVPMTEDEYYHFEWGARSGDMLALQPDGTYFAVGSAKRNGQFFWEAKTEEHSYFAVATVTGIKLPKKDCEDGEATVTLQVYRRLYTIDDYYNMTAEKLAKLEAEKKVEKVPTGYFEQKINITALKDHIDANGDGKCDNCEKQIKQDVVVDSNDVSKATVTIEGIEFAGTALTEKDVNITVKMGDKTLVRGLDYEVGELNIKAAGEYDVVIAGKGDYFGRYTGKLTVTEKAAPAPAAAKKQTLKLSVKAKTLKVKALAKKKATVKTKLTGAKTAVSYKLSTKAKKALKVKKSGKTYTVTVAKGTKKGKYVVKFTAKKTSAYKKATATLTITVK